MYSSASQLKNLLSVVGPVLGPYMDTITSQFEMTVMCTQSYLGLESEQIGINLFQDGSMLIFVAGRTDPVLINDMMELRYFVTKLDDREIIQQFAQHFAAMTQHYIETVDLPDKSDRELMIVDICNQYERIQNADS